MIDTVKRLLGIYTKKPPNTANELNRLRAFRDAVYAAAGQRPQVGETEPAWPVDLFEV